MSGTTAASCSQRRASSSEDDDYMSDALLSQVPDIRPGMLTGNAARRFKVEIEQKEANERQRLKPTKTQIEKEKRDEALNTPISHESKGFAMMALMGYKPGMALGKNKEGIKEPIPLDLKSDRTGLGHQTEKKRKAEERIKLHMDHMEKRQKMQHVLLGDYRSRKRELEIQKKVEFDLRKSQTVCGDLDAREGIEAPLFEWFWPEGMKKRDEEDEEGDEDEDEQEMYDQSIMLHRLNEYLREMHNYCVWCGHKFDSSSDLNFNCPGDSKDDHEDTDL